MITLISRLQDNLITILVNISKLDSFASINIKELCEMGNQSGVSWDG